MAVAFTTEVALHPLDEPLGHNQNWLCLGSCFADNIGMRLKNAGFTVLVNPFGVLFNPSSVSHAMRRLIHGRNIVAQDLFLAGSVWNHFSFSNLHSGVNKELTAVRMNQHISEAVSFFPKLGVVMLTWGTAWVYENGDTGDIVANCHKLPASQFRRRRLTVNEIVADYSDLMNLLPSDLKVVLSISPVRHWKDGARENTISKSVLHLASEELAQRFANIAYFPAFEIVVDELRDYRFYAADLIHPSDLAVDHVWQQFANFAFAESTGQIIKEVEHYKSMVHHRSIHPDSEQHLAFIHKTERCKQDLLRKYPFLKLD